MPYYQRIPWSWYCPVWYTGPSMPTYKQRWCGISVIVFYFWHLCNYYCIAYSTIKSKKNLKVPTASDTTQRSNFGGLILHLPCFVLNHFATRKGLFTCQLKIEVYKACRPRVYSRVNPISLLCLCLEQTSWTGSIWQSVFWRWPLAVDKIEGNSEGAIQSELDCQKEWASMNLLEFHKGSPAWGCTDALQKDRLEGHQ